MKRGIHAGLRCRRFGRAPIGYQQGRRERLAMQFPFFAWCYYFLASHITVRLLTISTVCVAPAAFMMMSGWQSRAFDIAFAVAAWIVGCAVAGFALRPRLVVEARLPARVECGSAFAARYEVRNVGRRTARGVSVETLRFPAFTALRLRSVALESLAPGDSATLAGGGKARMRGRFVLPALRWDADFPCGFWRWGRTLPETRTLAVYPRHARLDAFALPLGNRNRREVSAASQLTREAFEFHGCREFRDGDSLRHVHARSSARVGAPVVKEFQTEGRARTALLVDTRGRWMFGGTRERLLDIDPFEAALSVAASVVDYLATTDRVLELLVAGPEVYRFVSAGRIGYLEEVMDILAAVEPMKDDPLERLEPMLLDEIRLIQSVCLVFTGWDERRRRLVEELEAWEVGLRALLITPFGRRPPDAPDIVECLSARDVMRGMFAG